jgi:putative PIN family toxin of toxin-antitoxin system
MIDTNAIISALMFPLSKPADALIRTAEEHELVLCDYIISEVEEKVVQKRPDLLGAVKTLFEAMAFALVSSAVPSGYTIADPKDQPILDAAIKSNVDVIVSGDKHFKMLNLKKPKVLSPSDFLAVLERS